MATKEKTRYIERREVEGYREEHLSDCYRTWRCEIKIEPDHSYNESWYFWFTLPPKKEEDEKVRGAEIYFSYGHRLYVRAAEIVYDDVGEEVSRKPLFTNMGNLKKMVEHTHLIMEKFKEKYGL